MSVFFYTLLIISMVLLLVTLGAGMFTMAKGGDFALKYTNRIMRYRIYLQGIAIVLFLLAITFSSHS